MTNAEESLTRAVLTEEQDVKHSPRLILCHKGHSRLLEPPVNVPHPPGCYSILLVPPPLVTLSGKQYMA